MKKNFGAVLFILFLTGSFHMMSEVHAKSGTTQPYFLVKNGLAAGDRLNRGESIISDDGRYRFIMQDDGNLVLYKANRALWNSGTGGKAVEYCIMQDDGNLVLYGYGGHPVWDSQTSGPKNKGSRLILQDDGNVVIYRPNNSVVWHTNTYEKH